MNAYGTPVNPCAQNDRYNARFLMVSTFGMLCAFMLIFVGTTIILRDSSEAGLPYVYFSLGLAAVLLVVTFFLLPLKFFFIMSLVYAFLMCFTGIFFKYISSAGDADAAKLVFPNSGGTQVPVVCIIAGGIGTFISFLGAVYMTSNPSAASQQQAAMAMGGMGGGYGVY